MKWREGTVLRLRGTWSQCAEYEVALTAPPATEDAARGRALAYLPLVGKPEPGDRVLLQVSAYERELGTGGYMFICAIPDRLPADPPNSPGHIVKARYTPMQYLTLGVDEQESPYHELLRDADSLEGMPVIVADLHSALPAAVATLRAARPTARIAYVMDDGGALPAWFSQTATRLQENGQILGTISCGQAFGGDLEAVNIYTGLLAAKWVWQADVAIISQGPGNLGTDTRWGFSGTSAGEAINAVNALGGQAIGLLRMSSADPRERHLGLSHHTLTTLTRIALTPALCPVPQLDDSELCQLVGPRARELARERLGLLFAHPRLQRVDVPVAKLLGPLETSPVPLRTMGRGLHEDPLNFLAAGAAGQVAAELLEIDR
ncbi:Protein of unknown function [Actinobaculum suis]|uniref:DUF3866 family protein n=1 Tax=Actinobaculum suis TaxID=1657 RepID=A0A1G7C2R1_9ACTO|nr:DUF3866 family protein [Actinobaculum suis]MDY5153122.1 DUF3866 family protein [Actinobaculum suis]SDE33060.1 Protein of unknown function [Actinobaculum suis]